MAQWKQTSRRRRRLSYKFGSASLKRSEFLAKYSKLGFIGVIVLFLLSFVVFPLFAFNLPSPDKVIRREGFSTKILDRNGKVLYDIFSDERRTPVELGQIPENLKHATIAIEDKNFYEHGGFDPLGMLRGFSRIFTTGRAQGGSTLTQQLVKNVLLTPERSVTRKIKEFILAVQIERLYSKDQILQMYFNEAPYGGNIWGIEAAAETYFGKNVSDLGLVECAILAGMPQRPSTFSPYSTTPTAYVGRTQDVLRRMQEDGYISKEEEDQALADLENVQFQDRGASFKAPHFVQYVQKILEDRYGQRAVEQGGLKVTTTLDLDLQDAAQNIVSEEIEKVEYLNITNGAVVAMDPETGEVLAMVGSKNFNAPDYDGQVNVTTSLRQPGSAIKPITYVTGFEEGFTPATLIMDVPTEFPGGEGQPIYKPENYDGKYRGPLQVRYALPNSINVAAVKMLAMVGLPDMMQKAYDMGLSTLEPTKENLARFGLSLTLGGGEVRLLELTQAYAPFMNKGYRVDPVVILKVEDADGKVLEQVEPKKGNSVLSEENAFLIAHILSDNSARSAVFGTNSLLNIPGRTVAVKTGTTNDFRDNWAVGGNTQVVVGAWVGNNDNSQMKSVASGVSGATPIWRRILMEALKDKPNVGFEVPKGVVTAEVDAISGYAAHDGFPSRVEYFRKGTEPGADPVHVKLKVCKSDGKLATPSDISSGNYEEKEYYVFKEEDPVSGAGQPNKWQEGILAWANDQSDSRYHPPTTYCGTDNPMSVDFTDPKDHTDNLDNTFNIKISASSTAKITSVELYIDGAKQITFTGPPYNFDVNLETGTHELKALAKDSNGNTKDRIIIIGVKVPWNWTPTPAPTP